MRLVDPPPTAAALRRPLAVLVGLDGAVGADLAGALEAADHRVHCLPGLDRLVELRGEGRVATVVVTADALAAADLTGEPWASIVADDAVLFAVHGRDDEASALWRSYRRGAVPWPVGSAAALPAIAPTGSFGGELALDALHEELLGRHVAACRLLASIRDHDMVAEVVDVLVAAGAASLERLRNRSRYPVPTELLVQHLPAHIGTLQGPDFALWWNMVEAAAFRASGLRLPVPGSGLADGRFAVAFGAFHATSTIVRFTARRQWRQPADLLGDLAEVE